jgi:hypothetical protein
MSILFNCVSAFVLGAIYEVGCVFWVHFSEKGEPGSTAFFSMVLAAAEVAGIGESIHDLHAAPFFVLGYGTGTFVAVSFKRRLGK